MSGVYEAVVIVEMNYLVRCIFLSIDASRRKLYVSKKKFFHAKIVGGRVYCAVDSKTYFQRGWFYLRSPVPTVDSDKVNADAPCRNGGRRRKAVAGICGRRRCH